MAVIAAAAFVVHAADIDQDLAAMKKIGDDYAQGWTDFGKDIDKTIELYKGKQKAWDDCVAIIKTHADDLKAKNDAGRRIQAMCGHVDRGFNLFGQKVEEFTKDYSKRMDRELGLADSHVAEAERINGPGLFTMAEREYNDLLEGLKLYAGLGGDAGYVEKTRATVEAKLKDCQKRSAAYAKAHTREVKAPVEVYKGADKEKFRAAILKAWKAKYPNDKVIGVAFISESWKRNVEDSWNSAGKSWSHSDMSYLVAIVIVDKDTSTATMYPSYVNKNNLTGEISYGVDTKGGTFVVEDIAKSKLKK